MGSSRRAGAVKCGFRSHTRASSVPVTWLSGILVLVVLSAGRCFAAGSVKVGLFAQEVAVHREIQVGLTVKNILDVRRDDGGNVIAITEDGNMRWRNGRWESTQDKPFPVAPDGLPVEWQVAQVASFETRVAVATDRGLYEKSGSADWLPVKPVDQLGRLWTYGGVRAVTYDRDGQLWFATLAGVARRDRAGRWQFFEGSDGVPYNDFTCAAAAPDGSVWFGTRKGAIRYGEGNWSYRQGPRWLPHDHVRSILVDKDNRAWFATPGGVGCIKSRMLTLPQKSKIYEDEIDRFIKRTPFGYVASSRLARPGDRSEVVRADSDNDGLWTAMYGASQCFAYAVTKSEQSKARATQAFEALRFLQIVAVDSEHHPAGGFVARTVLPTTTADPNSGRRDFDTQFQRQRDRLWKIYTPRWPKSADGKWYWKGDTSSDELDGHYFFYGLYNDLVVASPAEKAELQKVVSDLTDHLINHDFSLHDHDGLPTRWARFGPSDLNRDPDWAQERGLNSLSILAYLAVAHHITGEARYLDASTRLKKEHHYDINTMVPKIQRGIGSGNQSDDEMAFMNFYSLLKYTTDPVFRNMVLTSFHGYWALEQPERNPFFHFAYAAHAVGESVSDPFGRQDITPWDGWLEDSLETLQGFPLDRLNWSHSNSHRIDIIPLPRQQGPDLDEGADSTTSPGRGHRVDGKVLPVQERHFAHWNTDPWRLDYPGDGRTLASGTVFLLPYYMGRYHGFIEEQ